MTGSMSRIENYLDDLFPNPKCELNYNKDYELLLATMLSAQTTDKRVNSVTSELFKKYPDLKSLSEANVEDVIDIIRPIGTFRRKAYNLIEISKRLCSECDGVLPNNRDYLESLPGVGRKTVNVVLSNIYNEDVIAVDTHVERVSKRLKLAQKKDDVLTVERKLSKKFKKGELCKRHHQMVLFGRYYCLARNPKCDTCLLSDICGYKKV
ncbi:MAG: endonuclease III [Bacilli bacterium]|nr:endonuclease III [Bacilli bacterium]